MAEYTIDKIEYDSNVYKLQDNVSGYITGISSSDVTTALGYTPLSSTSTLDATKLSGTIPAGCYTDTDTKMTQTYAAESGYSYWRPLIIGYSSGSTEGFTPSTVTNTAYAFKSLTVQPSTGTIRVGNVSLYKGSYTVKFSPDTLSANRTITVPNATGTLALTSDIPTVPTITLNGSTTTTPSFYAPTTAGTDGYYLKSSGSGAPTWAAISAGTDEKLKTTNDAVDNTEYYPIFGSNSTDASTKKVDTTGFKYLKSEGGTGSGASVLELGNNLAKGTTGNKRGALKLYGEQNKSTVLETKITSTGAGSNASVAVYFPDKGGTIALTDDLTDEKLAVTQVSSNGTYYPIFGTGTTAVTRQYDTTGFSYYEYNGETSISGSSCIILGNNIAQLTTGNKEGYIQLYGLGTYSNTIKVGTLNANRTVTLPNKSGTIALTDDIPSNIVTGSGTTDYLAKWSGTDTLSFTSLSIGTSYNSSSDLYGTIKLYVGSVGQIDWRGQLVFYDGSSKTITITPPSLTTSRTLTLPDKTGTVALTSDIPTVPTITLNGSSTTSPSFYAPTSAGTSGYYLKSNGSGAPTWTSFPTIINTRATATSGGTTLSLVNTGDMYTWNNKLDAFKVTLSYLNDTYSVDKTESEIQTAVNAGKFVYLYDSTGTDITIAPLVCYDDQHGITFAATTGFTHLNYQMGQDGVSVTLRNSGTVTSVAISNASNGGLSVSNSPITTTGTISIGHSNVLSSAQTTSGVYPIKIDKNGHISEYGSAITIPSITLNGSSTTSPSFYAPTSAGASGYILTSSGSGAPSWSNATATPTASTISKFDSYAHINSADMSTQDVSDFVDALDGQGANLADFVVEQGTSGIWTYRKWNSGAAECWGLYTTSAIALSRAFGVIYTHTNEVGGVNFPFTFTSAPIEVDCMHNANCWIMYAAAQTTTKSKTFWIARPSSNATATEYAIEIYVKGNWK